MRPIGFSTGALAYGDFRKGLSILRSEKIGVVELSALRYSELAPLIESLDTLDMSGFTYVAVHAPSQIAESNESDSVELLTKVTNRGWPIILHPDVIHNFTLWTRFENRLLIENMDKRKSTGRTASELNLIFEKLPSASLCFDLGHARQVDPTMSEAVMILDRLGSRLRQLHVSEVNTQSTHDPLTAAAMMAFKRVSHLIPEDVPVILESPVTEDRVEIEISCGREALPLSASKPSIGYVVAS